MYRSFTTNAQFLIKKWRKLIYIPNISSESTNSMETKIVSSNSPLCTKFNWNYIFRVRKGLWFGLNLAPHRRLFSYFSVGGNVFRGNRYTRRHRVYEQGREELGHQTPEFF